MRFGLATGAALVALLVTGGCDNMKHQAHSAPMDSTDQFSDGTSARTPPAHTVASGPRLSQAVETGADSRGPVLAFPLPLTAELLARGRDRYGIYCAMCHGDDGYGEGIVVRRGFPRPPSFHNDRLRSAPAGELYQAVALGVGKMYPLADRLDPLDRWAVVAYVRALQRSQHASLSDVPEPERAALLRP